MRLKTINNDNMANDGNQDDKGFKVGCIIALVIIGVIGLFMTSKEDFTEMGNSILGFGAFIVGCIIIGSIISVLNKKSGSNKSVNKNQYYNPDPYSDDLYNSKENTKKKNKSEDAKSCLLVIGILLLVAAVFGVVFYTSGKIKDTETATAIGVILFIILAVIGGIYLYKTLNDY